MRFWVFTIFSLLLSLLGSAEQCGRQADGALCPGGLCCSQYGWCGNTDEYCGEGCQSQCDGGGGGGGGSGGDIGEIISRDLFNDLLKQINDAGCEGKGFYSYDAFLTAAEAYPEFGTTGDNATRRREIAAFLAQTSHETAGSGSSSAEQCGRQADGALCPGGLCCSQYGWCGTTDEYCGYGCQSQCDGGSGGGGWASADPYVWGYCYVREINQGDYCDPNYPCLGKYYGRGPIQLSWNSNYYQAGVALGVDLISNPDLVATDPVISFKAAIWFWMTAQYPKPSCHDVITENWSPSAADTAAGRVPGYGVTTNIINGELECGKGTNAQVENRIGYFKKYCQVFGTDTGDNLDCYNQTHFGAGLLLDTI